jgi:hypothetical protein
MLATELLLGDKENAARTIHTCMLEDPVDILQGVYDDLKFVEEQDFWEVSERNTNIDYITMEQKDKLDIFFSWFPKRMELCTGSSNTNMRRSMSVTSLNLSRSPSTYGLVTGGSAIKKSAGSRSSRNGGSMNNFDEVAELVDD